MLRYKLSRQAYKPIVVDSHNHPADGKEHSSDKLAPLDSTPITATVSPEIKAQISANRKKLPNAQHPFITWLLILWIVVMVVLLLCFSLPPGTILQRKHKVRKSTQWSLFSTLTQPLDQVNISNTNLEVAVDCTAHQTLLQSRQSIDSAAQQYNPALLYSFPGSGNTWSRLLIEASTGYYSGSMYEDKFLLKTFTQEKAACSSKQVVIKAHPHLQHIADFQLHKETIDTTTSTTMYEYPKLPKKCMYTDISNYLDKVIFLVRHPYDAIWSEFQRRASKGQHNRVLQYNTDAVYQSLLSQWTHVVDDLMQKYIDMMTVDYPQLQQQARKHLVVRYEDLRNEALQQRVLSEMTTFLELPTTTPDTAEAQRIRLQCAFHVADQASIHRSNSSTFSVRPLQRTHTAAAAVQSPRLRKQFMKHLNTQQPPPSPSPPDRRRVLTAADVGGIFQQEDVYTQTEVCRIWNVIGTHAAKLGYEIYHRVQC